MKSIRLPMSLSVVGLLILTLVPATNAQYPRWLHGATGFARAIELQRELNVSLVLYFYTDRCSDCRTLEEQYLTNPSVHRALQRSIAGNGLLLVSVIERTVPDWTSTICPLCLWRVAFITARAFDLSIDSLESSRITFGGMGKNVISFSQACANCSGVR